MKILVPIKRVVDYNVKVRVKSDNSGVDIDSVKMSMNPFDEIALEEAVRLKEQGVATEVTVVTIAVAKSEDILRTALAMGADNAILVESDENLISLEVAKILQKITQEQSFDLVLLGKQSIDSDANQTGQMLSSLLGYSLATFASKITVSEKTLTVQREVDDGLETLKCNLPTVVTVDLRLNEPRYPSLPNIMKARAKPIKKLSPLEMGIENKQRIKVLKVEEPQSRSDCKFIESIADLYKELKTKEAIL